MRVCGVICEYNPFHNGHALHLARARERSGADYMVGVMSGSLTQRGAFARYDKWTRAEMALRGGCDLVLELPARFSGAPAPEFAAGGTALLAALGVVTHLSFGCEREALPHLARAAAAQESPAFREALRTHLRAGLSYPRARALALRDSGALDAPSAALSQPNAALAVEYLRTLPESIVPVPVVREGCGYHDAALGALSSATAVRAAAARGDLPGALASVPCPQLLEAAEARGDVHGEEALTQALLYALRTASAESLRAIAGMDEGLEYRFLAAAQTVQTRDALILSVKSKRYTYARLSRLCSGVLLHVTRDFAAQHAAPTYARALGFRRSAQPLLRAIKQNARIPLVTKTAGFDDPLFALDVRAQDLWALGCASPALRRSGRDYTTAPIIL